jgi:hypothetical protein
MYKETKRKEREGTRPFYQPLTNPFTIVGKQAFLRQGRLLLDTSLAFSHLHDNALKFPWQLARA